MLDHLAGRLAGHGVVMPLSFVNWPTTDPLDHPDEPLIEEDQVGVNANSIQPTAAWPGGYFAAYHAYPYYPDFQRHEPGIADCLSDGSVDPYAGYLIALRRHHAGLPVVVNEFGVPSSAAWLTTDRWVAIRAITPSKRRWPERRHAQNPP